MTVTSRALAMAVTELCGSLARERQERFIERQAHAGKVASLEERIIELRDEVLIVEKHRDILGEQIEAIAENRGLEFKSSQGALNLIHQRLLELEQKEANKS